MAQSGYTPILIYASGATGNTPSSSNLTSSSSGAELALNYYDGKLFYKDSGGTVQVLAGKGGTGVVAGSNTQIQFNNNGVFGASSGLTWDGSFLTATSIKDSALTSGRVTFAGASGLLTDSSSLTWDGTTFAASNISTGGSVTLSGGTANGVLYLNGSKVATSGSALVFDGTNLGIGTSSPVAKLHIVGGEVRLQQTGGYYSFYDTAGTTRVGYIQNATGNIAIVNEQAGFINFYTSNTERMRLDSSGNLGLGVTPSAWGNGVSMQGSGWSLSTLLGFDQSAMYTNARQTAYGDYNTNWVYRGTASATGYAQVSGVHVWLTAPSGTAGNAITFTPAMTLTGGSSSEIKIYTDTSGTGAADGLSVLLGSGGDAYLYNRENGPMIFGTNNAERSRITSGGDLLVGTTNAAENAGVGMKVLNTGGTVALVSNASDGTQQGFEMYSTTAAAYRLYINYAGTINATSTTISAISDQRLKENIRDLDFGLDKIMALKPRKFDWKTGKGKDIKDDRGWIAQEFEQVFPDLIDEWRDPAPEGEEPYKSVRADLIPVLVKAIQEQQALITALTARVSQLESQ